jgi:hypothetical protein
MPAALIREATTSSFSPAYTADRGTVGVPCSDHAPPRHPTFREYQTLQFIHQVPRETQVAAGFQACVTVHG